MPIDNDHLNPKVTVEEKKSMYRKLEWTHWVNKKIKGNIIKDTIAISHIVGNPQN